MGEEKTVPGLLAERVRRDGARPLVTYLDLSTGERMELSAASFANAVAKTAGLLRDELDCQPGDPIAVHLPLHWQTAVWWGACATTGAVCAPEAPSAPIGVTTTSHLDSITGCTDRVVVSLAPFGLPDGEPVPSDVIEAAVAARAHPDVFTPWSPVDPHAELLQCSHQALSGTECTDLAGELATSWDLQPGGRLLVTDTDWASDAVCPDSWLSLLAVPLVADASVVIVRSALTASPGATAGESDSGIADVMSSEKITARMGSQQPT